MANTEGRNVVETCVVYAELRLCYDVEGNNFRENYGNSRELLYYVMSQR
jgi:hypothetical protein